MRLMALVLGTASCGRAHFDVIGGDADVGDGLVGDGQRGPVNVAFVTSTSHTGNLGGLAGADLECATRAAAGQLTGTFVAWLSTTTVNAKDRLHLPASTTEARGWVRPDGQPIADRVSDLLAGTMFYPIRIDEKLSDVGPSSHEVMTGTTPQGVYETATTQCLDWMSASSSETFASGNAARTILDWSDYVTSSDCSTGGWRIYCFGVDYANPITPPAPSTLRKAFLSSATFDPATGLAGADGQCMADAQAQMFPGMFIGLLATSTQTAGARLDPSKGPWVLVNNTPLAATGAAILNGSLDTTIHLEASGVATAVRVWMGASDPDTLGTLATTCANWSNNTAGATGKFGKSNSSTSIFDDGSISCDQPYRVYCFEQ